jgi:predicted enzyme related to lactoylglutathione lyase
MHLANLRAPLPEPLRPRLLPLARQTVNLLSVPHGPQLVAFVPSSHLGNSHAFYSGVLGLKRTEASSQANEYDAHGTPVRVTLVPAHEPSTFTVLGWRVDDIGAAMSDLSSRGVQFRRYEGMSQDENGVWTAPGGSLIAWFEDPDGNVISLQQPPTSPAS